jgi:cellulose biosynthesis protein BcsQ
VAALVYIVSFFSPLGGVWRSTTLLLAATAYAHCTGEKVLAVDLDVTTPALLAYLDREVAEDLQKPIMERRFFTFIDAYNRYRVPPRPRQKIPEAPWLQDLLYILPSSASSLIAAARRIAFARYGPEAQLDLARRIRRLLQEAARLVGAELVVVDTSPGIHQFGQAALRASDAVIILSRPDPVSIRRLELTLPEFFANAALRPWPPHPGLGLPTGDWEMRPQRFYMVYTYAVNPKARAIAAPWSKEQHVREVEMCSVPGLEEVHEKLRATPTLGSGLPLLPRVPERYTVIPLVEDLLKPAKPDMQVRNHVALVYENVKKTKVRETPRLRRFKKCVIPDTCCGLEGVWRAALEIADVLRGWLEIEQSLRAA